MIGTTRAFVHRPARHAPVGARPTSGIVVDASCMANPYIYKTTGFFHGRVEWQGRDLLTGRRLFGSRIYEYSTINLGEYMAIVTALRHLHGNNDRSTAVYSDSRNAINWVKMGLMKTKLPREPRTHSMWREVDEAMEWLRDVRPANQVLKWETRHWGENPADYGRK